MRALGSLFGVVTPTLTLRKARSEDARDASPEARLAEAAARDFQFLWRSLRRLGVTPDAAVDDAVQRVFEIAARKAKHVDEGHERAFLFKTALLVAAEERRGQRRARERDADAGEGWEAVDPRPAPDAELEARRARALLDEVLSAMPLELRTVFVLFELEEMPSHEIAAMLGIPPGTAASRLRRAREEFHAVSRRLRGRLGIQGGVR